MRFTILLPLGSENRWVIIDPLRLLRRQLRRRPDLYQDAAKQLNTPRQREKIVFDDADLKIDELRCFIVSQFDGHRGVTRGQRAVGYPPIGKRVSNPACLTRALSLGREVAA